MVEHRIGGHYGFKQVALDKLELTQAAQMDAENPKIIFRDLYGDYFICGFRRHYSFRTIVHCN